MAEKKNVLVVGASRGLGLALAEEYCARDWQVIATRRGSSAGLHALSKCYPSSLEIETVDIVDLATVQALRSRLDGRKLDVLFVNAGISKANELTPIQVEEKDYLDMLLTNALSPIRVIELFHDQVATNGVIAVMSSELGSITNSTWLLGTIQLQQGGAEHADEKFLSQASERSSRAAVCCSGLGADRHGHAGRHP